MTEHLSTRQLAGYRGRSLSAAELLSACDHVAACASCASRLADDASVPARVDLLRADLQASGEPRHLSYEELDALTDGRLDPVDSEIVAGHLTLCGSCAEEARDLAEAAARPVGARARPQRPVVRALAALAAAAVIAGVAWLGGKALQVEGLRRQVAELEHANRALREGARVGGVDVGGGLANPGALDPALRAVVDRALATGDVQAPAFVASLVGPAESLLGPRDVESFALLGPVGTAVTTDRPTFRWHPVPGGATYTVAVFDSHDAPAFVSPPLSVPEWKPERALPRGRDYAWQVTAVRDGREVFSPAPPAPPARFRVLEAARVADLDRALASSADSHLVQGILCAQAGVLDDAERELREFLRAHPDSEVARRLLQGVRAQRAPEASR